MLQISEKNYGSGKLKCSCFFQSENMPNLCPYKLVNVMLIKKSVIQLNIYLLAEPVFFYEQPITKFYAKFVSNSKMYL